MDSIVVLSPVGRPAVTDKRALTSVESLEGKRVAFLWGMHGNSLKFWPVFEEEAIRRYGPSLVVRHHKLESAGQFTGNTWIPAPGEVVRKIVAEVDYVLCGVGA